MSVHGLHTSLDRRSSDPPKQESELDPRKWKAGSRRLGYLPGRGLFMKTERFDFLTKSLFYYLVTHLSVDRFVIRFCPGVCQVKGSPAVMINNIS